MQSSLSSASDSLMPRWHDVEQNTEEWMNLRLGKATASSFGIIMANDGKAFGEPAKRYALDLALQRLTGRRASSFTNAHMERGHQQEPIARDRYEQLTGDWVTNGGFFDCDTHGDSPDGLIEQDGVLEIKCVIASVHYETICREAIDPAYKWQIAGHLLCSGRAWVDFASYCDEFPSSSNLIVYRVHREEQKEQLERLAARLAEFEALVSRTVDNIPI